MISNAVLMLFSSLGFSIVIGTKPKHYIHCALLGMSGYILHYFLKGGLDSDFISAIICAGFFSIISQLVARKRKAPATIFLLPAILSLIPGSRFFYCVSSALAQSTENTVRYLIETIEYTAGISIGIMLGATVFKIFMNIRAK